MPIRRAGIRCNAGQCYDAATAEVGGLTLVTRNASDFEASLDAIINPWAAE